MHHHWHFMGRGNRGHGPGGGFFGRFGGFMGGGGEGFRAARMLASGDLQLIILSLLAEKPRHGYEIIKALEDHSSGVYTPSPGVVYPALTYLEEVSYASAQTEGNKKLYTITDAGKQYLEKNRETADETLTHLARFGKKMARVRRHFAEEEAENELDRESDGKGRAEWRRTKMEFREMKEELKSALWDKIDAAPEEKKRVLEILKRAVDEIRGKK